MADVLFKTYNAIGNREDLTDIITNISPIDTPMLSNFGVVPVAATYHEWQTDELASASSTGVVEGSDPTVAAVTATTRTGNYTMIRQRTFGVTNTQQAVLAAGRSNEYNYQKMKKLKELARDIEKSIHDGTGNSGASGTAREVKGVRSWVATNVETGTGTGSEALTSSMLNDLLQTIWAAGGNPDAIFVNGYQKRQISTFTTPVTRNIEGNKYSAVISVYESDFGVQRVFLDRYATATELLALELDKWKVGYLRPAHHMELPDQGGGPRGKVEAEFTLEARNEAASGKITGLSTS